MAQSRPNGEDVAFSHKIDYVTIVNENINLERHPNRITGSRVTVILLNGWILPISGLHRWRVGDQQCYPI